MRSSNYCVRACRRSNRLEQPIKDRLVADRSLFRRAGDDEQIEGPELVVREQIRPLRQRLRGRTGEKKREILVPGDG